MGYRSRASAAPATTTSGARSGRMAGIFTERDVMRRVLGKRLDPASVRVAEVMTNRVICCTPATSIEEARELMRSRRIRHLPILDAEGEVVGVVSIGDLNAHLTTHQEVTIHYLEELKMKAFDAQKKKHEVSLRQVDKLSAAIYPNSNFQERELNFIYFVYRYGTSLIGKIFEELAINKFEHQVINI